MTKLRWRVNSSFLCVLVLFSAPLRWVLTCRIYIKDYTRRRGAENSEYAEKINEKTGIEVYSNATQLFPLCPPGFLCASALGVDLFMGDSRYADAVGIQRRADALREFHRAWFVPVDA